MASTQRERVVARKRQARREAKQTAAQTRRQRAAVVAALLVVPALNGAGAPQAVASCVTPAQEKTPADHIYPADPLAMARHGDDGASMDSQSFLVYQDSTNKSDTAGGFMVFGRITQGLDVVQAVADAGVTPGAESPATPVTIEGVETQ